MSEHPLGRCSKFSDPHTRTAGCPDWKPVGSFEAPAPEQPNVRLPVCYKAGISPYPCNGLPELRKNGNWLCEEHWFQEQQTKPQSVQPTTVVHVPTEQEIAAHWFGDDSDQGRCVNAIREYVEVLREQSQPVAETSGDPLDSVTVREVHNRFCGENGHACQAHKLINERDAHRIFGYYKETGKLPEAEVATLPPSSSGLNVEEIAQRAATNCESFVHGNSDGYWLNKEAAAIVIGVAIRDYAASLEERLAKTQDGLVDLQKHRDAWRGYAYGIRNKPQDFLDGNMVDRPPTFLEVNALKLAAAEARADKAEARAMRYENDEASVCPEDVGFIEFIGVLQRKLTKAEAERNKWKARYEEMGQAAINARTDADTLAASLRDVQETHRWIPISERMPEDGSSVLICLWDGTVESAFRALPTSWQLERTDSYDMPIGYDNEQIACWMPIPKPDASLLTRLSSDTKEENCEQ